MPVMHVFACSCRTIYHIMRTNIPLYLATPNCNNLEFKTISFFYTFIKQGYLGNQYTRITCQFLFEFVCSRRSGISEF